MDLTALLHSDVRDLAARARDAYYNSPRVNVHVNGALTGLASATIVAAYSGGLDALEASAAATSVSAVIPKEVVAWGLPSWLHYHANAAAFSGGDGVSWGDLAKGLGHLHISGLVPGIAFTAIGAGGQYLLAEQGVGYALAGFMAYTLAIIPSRLIHDRVARRTGLFTQLQGDT